ncbi:MAG TPA: DMT family transporter [Gammaproteobacteria bacterium]|nr:DMT family transporter [Gammaproteobacteria bacterium]
MNRLQADLLLLLTAFIWGTAFVAQKYANDSMPPITIVGARFLISALVLLPFMLYEAKRATAPLSRIDWMQAGIVGLCLCAGSCLQQTGLLTTSATNGGFLTALYVVIVPFMFWAVSGQKPRALVLLACGISLYGAWLLADDGQSRHWRPGDILMVVSDFAWALAITLIGVFLQRSHRPFFLSFMQYAVTAALALPAGFLFESPSLAGTVTALWPLLYIGLISGGLAYTFGVLAQKHTPPAEAALIMCLESVFAALAGAMLLHERLTVAATVGCALILLGVVLVETGPLLLRKLGITAA